jgi:putative peptide zinc metalloprotease protein
MVIWSLFTAVVMPLAKGVRYIASDPSIDLIRGQVVMKVGGALSVIFAILFVLPLPNVTVADAVLEPGNGDLVRVQGRGFVERVLVTDGQTVQPGSAVMALSDPLVSLQRKQAEADRDDAVVQLGALPLSDQNGRQLWQDQVAYTEAKLADLTKREAGLIVHADAAGQVYVPNQTELTGRLVQQGEVVAVILSPGPTRWQVAIPATEAPYVDAGNRSIELLPRPSHDLTLQAQILTRAPEVTTSLPSFGLTTKGGGTLLVDPSSETPVSLEPVVNYLLEVPQTGEGPFPQGSRARVRFIHDPSPIGPRIWRAIERTFLRQFGG